MAGPPIRLAARRVAAAPSPGRSLDRSVGVTPPAGWTPMLPLFVSLDGIDGTGKSTHCRLLADWLRGQELSVTTCVDPGGTPIGDELRAIVLGHRHELSLRCEALLFMASRA